MFLVAINPYWLSSPEVFEAGDPIGYWFEGFFLRKRELKGKQSNRWSEVA